MCSTFSIRHSAFSIREGFSLIEVNLAILLVALGLLSLFALFPMGLRESDMAVVDTQEAMFADTVLSAMEGNAMAVTNWTTWTDFMAFKNRLVDGITLLSGTWSLNGSEYVLDRTDPSKAIDFPQPTNPDPDAAVRKLRYDVVIKDRGVMKSVTLRAKSGKYASFTEAPGIYYSEFVFMGM